MKAKALVVGLAEMLAEVETATLSDTLVKVGAEALVLALADTLAEVEAENLTTHWPK